MKYNYKKLSKMYTPEELADAFVFPVELTPKQKKEAARQLAEARKKIRENETEEDRLEWKLFDIRMKIHDYVEDLNFNPELTFGYFLKKYVEAFDIKRKNFAEELSIDETLLSQLINGHRMPPEYVIIRLEIHSNGHIPATGWMKLVNKQRIHELRDNKDVREKEKPFVRSRLLHKASA